MKLFNTLGRKKEEFKPIKKGHVLMYHCGPTVYWIQHLGHMRAAVLADTIIRTFKYLGYKTKLVSNYTDVGHLTSDSDEGEDKMEKGARRENLSPKEIANKYIDIFEKDIKRLNVLAPNKHPRATECIKEIIKMVQVLLDKGFAYQTDLAIYFDVTKAKNYTALSGQNLEENIKDAGKGEVSDPQKKHAADFAVWFFKAGSHQNALQFWKSPFTSSLVKNGEGFPGWHIECSVMAKKFLGDTIDIHMGGIEHVPVHHTNEIAQSEAANGVKFVKYWLHNEHLMVNGGKMSKSTGTSYVLDDVIAKNFNPLVLRYFFLQAHYRSKQNFTWEALEAVKTAYNKLVEFLSEQPQEKQISRNQKLEIRTDKRNSVLVINYKKEFLIYISDDFNIPAALALVWEVVKNDLLPYSEKKKLILDFDKVLGLGLDKIKKEKIEVPAEVLDLVKERETARANKNWQKADELRDKISNLGFTVEDKSEGSSIKKL
jgi:cysteinyl-tRNA synthetase